MDNTADNVCTFYIMKNVHYDNKLKVSETNTFIKLLINIY